MPDPATTEWDPIWFQRLEDATAEFEKNGEVWSVECHKCEGLVTIKATGTEPRTLTITCPCGYFDDVVKTV